MVGRVSNRCVMGSERETERAHPSRRRVGEKLPSAFYDGIPSVFSDHFEHHTRLEFGGAANAPSHAPVKMIQMVCCFV
jgi:hypothetical protein